MNSFSKLAAVLVFGLLLFGCTQPATSSATPTATPIPSQPGLGTPTPTPFASSIPPVPDTTVQSGTVQEFAMEAKQFEFVPSTLTVKKGQPVKITFTTTDVPHSFSLPDFNVNVPLQPGQPAVAEFTPDKAGTFTFACRVFCGAGHSGMQGQLIVEE